MTDADSTPLLHWQSRLCGRSGYATLAREYLEELNRRGKITVSFDHLIGEQENPAGLFQRPWYREIAGRKPAQNSPYLIFHTPAGVTQCDYYGSARAMNPGHSTYVGYTMFETDRIPASWVKSIRGMDEIWVPTEFNVETFAASGVDPEKIRVMPFGIDPRRFDPRTSPPLRPAGSAEYRFLSVFEWTWRKGWDVLIRAYCEEFSARDDVSLTLLTYRGDGANLRQGFSVQEDLERYLFQELGVSPKDCPNIELELEPVPDDQWAGFLAGHDAYILPTRGEGWGLPFLEAMAMGLPTALTDWGAPLQFASSENSYLIYMEGLTGVDRAQLADNPLFAGHLWAQPSLESTRKALRQFFENPEDARQLGARARSHILEHFTLEKAVERVETRIAELSEGARPILSTPSESQPLRLLWIGDDLNEDGLKLALSCFFASFEPGEKVELDLAVTIQLADQTIEKHLESFRKIGGLEVRFVGIHPTFEARQTLYQKADVFLFPGQRNEVSQLCLEAAREGLLVVASDPSLPTELKQEDWMYPLPCRKVSATRGEGRRELICKPYPNVVGNLLRWIFRNRERKDSSFRKQRVAELLKKRPESIPVPVFRSEGKRDSLPPEYESRILAVLERGDGEAGAWNRLLSDRCQEYLGVETGKPVITGEEIRRLQADRSVCGYYHSSPEGNFLLLRINVAAAYPAFDSFFSGQECTEEFVRAVLAKGGKIIGSYTFEGAPGILKEVQEDRKGLAELRQLLEDRPGYAGAMIYLASRLSDSGQAREKRDAVKALEAVLLEQPFNDEARHLLGRLCHQIGRDDEAFEALEFAVRLNPEEAKYWNDLGVVRSAREDFEGGLEAFIRARILDDNYLDALKNGADLYTALGDVQKAVNWLVAAVERFPQDKEVKSRLAQLAGTGASEA